MLTNMEKSNLDRIYVKLEKAYKAIELTIKNRNDLNIAKVYLGLREIKNIIGNYNQDVSFVSCLLAKEYLLENYEITDFDVSLKSQSAPGHDIEVVDKNGKKIIAEIKTTFPYNAPLDFGSKQKEEIEKDLSKLQNAQADYKYFFVTEIEAYKILSKRYKNLLMGISLVCLGEDNI